MDIKCLMQSKENRLVKKVIFNLQCFDDGGDGGDGGSATPKSQEDIVAALQGLDGGAAYVSGLNQLVAAGTKAHNEAKTLKAQITKLTNGSKALTTERDSAMANYNKMLDFIGIPADTEDLDTALTQYRETQKSKNGVDAAKLQSQINDLMRKGKTIEKERDESKKVADERLGRIHSIIRDSAVESALKKSGALEYDALVPIFRDKVQILEDETPVYPLEDGTQVTVEEGVKSFFEKHPRLLANNQNPGAGSGGGAPGKVDFNNMTQAQYEKMRKEGKI